MPEQKTTARKAHSAAGGAGLGAAISELAIYAFGLDREIGGPLTIVISAALAWIGAFFPTNRPR